MGGCRCSYRNCKVRSDGKTHMFHFPVFDKMRCHQWITNSHKPNFLNLKLSQLKNRVICQHHFNDDNFMNFMRDKLKSTAVPTEDGPYCVADQIQTVIAEDDKPVIPINPDDIENETLNYVEKKAHSSVKYGDFLISDVTELFNCSHTIIDSHQASQKASKKLRATQRLFDEGIDLKSKALGEEGHNYTIIYSNDEPIKASNKTITLNTNTSGPNPSLYAIEYEEAENSNKLLNTHTPVKKNESESLNVFRNDSYQRNPDKVVKIISEKKISEPVIVEGTLEPMSPSMIISRQTRKLRSGIFTQRKRDIKPQLKNEDVSVQANNNNITQEIVMEQILPIEHDPKDMTTVFGENQNVKLEKVNAENQNKIINLNNIELKNNFNDEVQNQKETVPFEQAFLNCMIETAEKLIEPEFESKPTKEPVVTPNRTPVFNKSILKNKITPEKLAAIEAKRKFNLKLRDVISSCLDNLDEQPVAIDKKTPKKQPIVKQSICSKDPTHSSQGNVVDYLEARLQKMENTLLNKIDYNTQRINELKRAVKPSRNVKNANTQTYLNHMTELSQKQYLYKEISKFLSPNAIIKVYEELFVKPEEEIATPTPRKLRKRR